MECNNKKGQSIETSNESIPKMPQFSELNYIIELLKNYTSFAKKYNIKVGKKR